MKGRNTIKNYKNKIKHRLSALVVLTLLTTFLPTAPSYAYTTGANIIPLTQINDAAKISGWTERMNSKYQQGDYFTLMNANGDFYTINDGSSYNTSLYNDTVYWYSLSGIRNDIIRRDPSVPIFRDAYLQEMHQKGLLLFNNITLCFRYSGGYIDSRGNAFGVGINGSSGYISSKFMYGTEEKTMLPPTKQFKSLPYSSERLLGNSLPAGSITIKYDVNTMPQDSFLVSALGTRGRYDWYYTADRSAGMYLDLAASNIEVTILPDTSQVGKIYDTVQSIPTTLNNTVNQINNSLSNQPLALVYIPNNSQRIPQLAKLGLPSTITTDGIYKSSDGFKYKVVLYTPPTNVDQLNMT